MKKILMITTGGTIASRAGKNGLTPAISPKELLSYIPSVKNICEVDALEAAITKLMWISGLGVRNYEELRELFYTQINHDILFTKRIESE